MTIDGTRDPLGRLPVAQEGEVVCGDKHWLGFACQAEIGHEGRCRHYDRGARYEWNRPGEDWAMVMVVRSEEGS